METKKRADDVVERIGRIINIPSGEGIRATIYCIVLGALEEEHDNRETKDSSQVSK